MTLRDRFRRASAQDVPLPRALVLVVAWVALVASVLGWLVVRLLDAYRVIGAAADVAFTALAWGGVVLLLVVRARRRGA